jgi:glyoxylase-like metal-dependent hydrolase (beta-lactamase superfamily II)
MWGLRKLPIKRNKPRGGAQALASLDALLGIEAGLLLPGHGDPWTEGVAEAVRRARAAGRS